MKHKLGWLILHECCSLLRLDSRRLYIEKPETLPLFIYSFTKLPIYQLSFTMILMSDDNNDHNHKKDWVGAEKYIQLGIMLPAAVFIGWILGAALDRWLHTHWLSLVGLLLGIAAGFVQLVRIGMSSGSKD